MEDVLSFPVDVGGVLPGILDGVCFLDTAGDTSLGMSAFPPALNGGDDVLDCLLVLDGVWDASMATRGNGLRLFEASPGVDFDGLAGSTADNGRGLLPGECIFGRGATVGTPDVVSVPADGESVDTEPSMVASSAPN